MLPSSNKPFKSLPFSFVKKNNVDQTKHSILKKTPSPKKKTVARKLFMQQEADDCSKAEILGL
jgi:hypothetical protein